MSANAIRRFLVFHCRKQLGRELETFEWHGKLVAHPDFCGADMTVADLDSLLDGQFNGDWGGVAFASQELCSFYSANAHRGVPWGDDDLFCWSIAVLLLSQVTRSTKYCGLNEHMAGVVDCLGVCKSKFGSDFVFDLSALLFDGLLERTNILLEQ